MAVLQVPDGRAVEYELSGPVGSDGVVLVFHHGQPGAALLWPPMIEAAARHGWAVLMLSRAGYAGSERQEGRSVASAADDVEALLDHIVAGRCVVAGWSGGGPHALACGARLAPRSAAVATLASIAPWGSPGLDWTAGMGPENVEEFEALAAGDPELEGRIRESLGGLKDVQADGIIEAFGGLLSEPDKEVLTGGFAEHMAEWMRRAASAGSNGYWDDDQAWIKAWGFDLGAMAIPAHVWWGDLDLMVPPTHGAWLAEAIPDAVPFFKGGEGHLSVVVRYIDEIVDRLADGVRAVTAAEPGGEVSRAGRIDARNPDRLETFSDGVMAVIITIMAFGLHAPSAATWHALGQRVPNLLVYVLSFTFIGIYWNNHHHLLRATHRISAAVMWTNLYLLFWLSLMPVVTSWVGSDYRDYLPAAMYGVVAVGAAIAYGILVHALIRANGRDSTVARAIGSDFKGNLSVVTYLAAIGLAWVSPWISYGLYVAVAVVWFVPDRRFTRASPAQ